MKMTKTIEYDIDDEYMLVTLEKKNFTVDLSYPIQNIYLTIYNPYDIDKKSLKKMISGDRGEHSIEIGTDGKLMLEYDGDFRLVNYFKGAINLSINLPYYETHKYLKNIYKLIYKGNTQKYSILLVKEIAKTLDYVKIEYADDVEECLKIDIDNDSSNDEIDNVNNNPQDETNE